MRVIPEKKGRADKDQKKSLVDKTSKKKNNQDFKNGGNREKTPRRSPARTKNHKTGPWRGETKEFKMKEKMLGPQENLVNLREPQLVAGAKGATHSHAGKVVRPGRPARDPSKGTLSGEKQSHIPFETPKPLGTLVKLIKTNPQKSIPRQLKQSP